MTPRTWQLLRQLSDGAFHSGDELGLQLGVSRATVFAALENVADFGVQLQRIRGRGYRLAQPWHGLDSASIVRNAAARFQIEILQQAASSNTELLKRATQGAASGSVLAVELQTAGRGRIGRTWHSGLGNALTFSLLWRFECGLNALSGLSLVVGLAICRALNRFGAVGVGLKWPNDLLTARGKLGGVLIEAQGDMYGPSAVVIGIGINCTLPLKVAQAITQRATALDQVCAMPPDRNQLLGAILQELAQVLDEFSHSGFATQRAEWERYHAYQNLPVQLQMPDGTTISGIARGVSDNGELLLETPQGIRQYNSGEVGVAA
ncbi:MAG: biotin--[acetyl-CoA-carboxylase] ligase [Gallionella sp.]|jgi:BirA family biotin operon repressor/biotin-[acetyl-CoA-carboxylase] ligase